MCPSPLPSFFSDILPYLRKNSNIIGVLFGMHKNSMYNESVKI